MNIIRTVAIGTVTGLIAVGVHAATTPTPTPNDSPIAPVVTVAPAVPIATDTPIPDPTTTAPAPTPTPTPAVVPLSVADPASAVVVTSTPAPGAVAPPETPRAPTRQQLNDLWAEIGAPGENRDQKLAACIAWPLPQYVCEANEDVAAW